MTTPANKRVTPSLSDTSNMVDDFKPQSEPVVSPGILTRPRNALLWMTVFLVALAALVGVIFGPLSAAFMANGPFNGLIVGVLAIGVLVNYRQVLALYREIGWIEEFRRSNPARPPQTAPRLLAPMSRLLTGRERGEWTLSTASLRSLLDSIRSRLDESRDLARYLIGLLIFLGLLGTFWGLLATIGDVSSVLGGLNIDGSDGAAMFESLKQGLKGPLEGMGIAFSSSLFGLAGSLILGFLDLQANHAQNRFFNELEEWLSGNTRLSSGALPGDGEAGVPAYVQALLEQTADGLERMQRTLTEQVGQRTEMERQLGTLNHRLADLARAQGNDAATEELRAELRLMTRTIAAALKHKNP